METAAQLKTQLLETLQQMHQTLDQQRWRRMPALRQQVMTLFERYCLLETQAAELAETKRLLRDGFGQLLARRQQRAAELEKKMAQHRENKEGVLAYSMMALLTEQS
ncbi:flagellar protein FliT [Atlantibacter subterraneus]|uniref:flagellar protein FliT n=1 Tax=Atlantibacter subterraneus TaxID=255519 RepID=UPI00289C3EBF|nr:flagellar protein FliT [Atlantibacter subterranea]